VTDPSAVARPMPGLDLARLEPYLADRLPLSGRISAELFAGGKSNLTYAVSDGDRTWVLRRPPLGHTLATAHDMAREFRVLEALAGSAVPVPAVEFLCVDADVIGTPFYVMERRPGRALRDPDDLAALGPEPVRRVIDRLIDILVDLHAIDPAAVGLADFGRPDGYNERQLQRWSRQLAASMTGDIPGLVDLETRLAESLPGSPPPTVVHGDYRLDNVLVDLAAAGSEASAEPEITAVLDWEMSTLGDPAGDLALTLLYASRSVPEVTAGASGRPAVEVPGHPSEAEIVRRYVERSGREVPDLRWYSAFARFKLAAIAQGVHHRYLGGGYGDLPGFAGIGAVVAPLMTEALHILDGAS